MNAEKYYTTLRDNGILKLLKRQDTRDKIKAKLIIAFSMETRVMVKKLGNEVTNEKYADILDSQNKKWNELNKILLTKHGVSPIQDNAFMDFWVDALQENMTKGEQK